MDTIQQLTNNKKIAIVWYGECGEDCVDYGLNDSANATETNKIDHIYEIADDQTKSIFYSSYVGHIHNGGLQTLTTLQCGHAYYVVLKEGNDTLSIPNMTLAHAGISAGKISQSCAIAPEIEFVDLDANIPADLKLKITVNIDDLVAPCAANTWKYKIIKGGETETGPYDGTEYGPYEGDNTTLPGVDVETISIAMSEGGIYYKVVIWGENANGDKITEEPDQEKVVLMPWPSGLFSITGTVDVDYLEYEGPSGASPQQTLSGQDSLINTLHLIKPSMKTTSGADTNIENWQYQINSDAWVDYDTIANDSSVVLAYTDKISWRLKVGLSAGNEFDDSTNYNATMVVKCVENNGTIKFAEKDLLGEVHNQRITITSLTDNRNNTTTLNVDLFTASKFKYKLEKLNAENGIVEKNYWEYANTTISSTTLNINTLPMISNVVYGPGWYQVTAQAWNTSRKVSDVDAVEKTYINWATATLSATNSVSDSYSENAGPSEGLPVTVSASWIAETSVEFNGAPDSKWEYQIGTDAWTSLSEINVNLPMSAVSGTQSSLSTFKVRMKAGLTKETYNEQINWFATGKDATNKTDTTTLNGTVSEPVVGPGLLWLGFAGTDVSGDLHYSDWFEMNVNDTENVFIDLDAGVTGWNGASAFTTAGMISNCQDGTTLEFGLAATKKLYRCKHSGILPAVNDMVQDQIGTAAKSALGASTNEAAWTILEGKELKSEGGKLGVFVAQDLPYTKLTIKDHPAMTTSLSGFGGANLAYIAMIDSPTKPNATDEGTKIFGAGSSIDLSCIECGSTQPSLKVVEADKTNIYDLNVYKSDGSCGNAAHITSYKDTSDWKDAPGIYSTDNAGAPGKQNQFTELYFANGNDKLKLQDLSC